MAAVLRRAALAIALAAAACADLIGTDFSGTPRVDGGAADVATSDAPGETTSSSSSGSTADGGSSPDAPVARDVAPADVASLDVADATVNCNAKTGHCTCYAIIYGTNATACSPQSLAPSAPVWCCADPGYPTTSGATCDCSEVHCQGFVDSCSCFLSPASQNNEIPQNQCTGSVCCSGDSLDECDCYTGRSTCPSGFTATANCNASAPCRTGRTPVAACH
jgi:hypothetical protein